MWLMAGVLRENIQVFREHHTNGDFSQLASLISDAIAMIRSVGEETIKFGGTLNFVKMQNTANEAFQKHNTAYEIFMTTGYRTDDLFSLFTNALEDFTTYMAVYIAIRTGDWSLRVAGIKRLKEGAWVSALKDSRGATLARNEKLQDPLVTSDLSFVI